MEAAPNSSPDPGVAPYLLAVGSLSRSLVYGGSASSDASRRWRGRQSAAGLAIHNRARSRGLDMSARVKDGLVKRGSTWSYVVRVADPETGLSRPRWVGGFPTEVAAKAARDSARESRPGAATTSTETL